MRQKGRVGGIRGGGHSYQKPPQISSLIALSRPHLVGLFHLIKREGEALPSRSFAANRGSAERRPIQSSDNSVPFRISESVAANNFSRRGRHLAAPRRRCGRQASGAANGS